MRVDQGGGNGISGALYTTSMELSNQPPLLPQTRSGDALLVAALQGTPVPMLAATDVAVTLGDAPGSSSAAAEVYAFGPSQPGIYLIAVRWPLAATTPCTMAQAAAPSVAELRRRAQVTSPANYTGQVVVSLSNLVAVAPLTYLVAGPSILSSARATAWHLSQLVD
jgi:hypothetical protein